jgi:hypothetical protein
MSKNANEFFTRIEAGLAGYLHDEIEITRKKLEAICESPIEVALAAAILFMDRLVPVPGSPLILSRTEDIAHYGGAARLLIPQFQLDDKRIDFLLRDPPIEIYLECDGHDFHERTKEQAARDRKRDREVQQTGRPILRFTGSEIYADPVFCASEVFDFLGDLHMYDYQRRTA